MEYEPLPIISQNFVDEVVPIINIAVQSIDIIVFQWRFYKRDLDNKVSRFNRAIADAVKRGVRVRCLVQQASAVNELKNMGCQARKLQTKRLLHAKLLIIDGNGIVLGSHNYTMHAFASNYEASVFFILDDKQNAFSKYFSNLWGL
jgi:phosphatidylserine/phosphatidylglycerophosphate/cardiolipin synthase-like enzyme